MRRDEYSNPLPARLRGNARNLPRAPLSLALISALALLLLACATGCAPSSASRDGRQSPSSAGTDELPELTEETIREQINETSVWDVPEENGAAEPIGWRFDEEEPKEIVVIEKRQEGDRATIVLDIKTRSSARMRNPRSLAGQIRTEWRLKTGWALRRWSVVGTENISMKYKNLPKPTARNAER